MSTAAPEETDERPRLELPRRRQLPQLASAFLILVGMVAIFAPLIVSGLGLGGPTVRHPAALNLFGNPTGPSGAHPLGVDTAGRDVLSRLLYAVRSLVLVVLAGGLAAVLAGRLAGWLCGLHRWAALALETIFGGVRAYPALLLGLAVGVTLGPGVWRLIVAVALSQLALLGGEPAAPAAAATAPGAGAARSGAAGARGGDDWDRARLAAEARRGLMALARILPAAVAIDFGLTFIADGPGGTTPQLGAMVAQSGQAILRGVPGWWALLFPGLVVLLIGLAARRLASHARRAAPAAPSLDPGLLGVAAMAVARALVVLAVAALAFTSLAGTNAGRAALARLGRELSASVSLLAGGAVVWLAAAVVQVWLASGPLATGARGAGSAKLAARAELGSRADRLGTGAARLLAAAPAGWVAYLALYVFSESIGKAPVLPGAGAYTGLTHDAGRWAQALVMPWLVLGLSQAAALAPPTAAQLARQRDSAQQQVARAAGVPEARLRRQLRRAALAPLLARARDGLPAFISTAVVIEVAFELPGLGTQTVRDFIHGANATVADVAVLGALVVIAAGLLLDLGRMLADPGPRTVAGTAARWGCAPPAGPVAAQATQPARPPAGPVAAAATQPARPPAGPVAAQATQPASPRAALVLPDHVQPLHAAYGVGAQIAAALAGTRRAAYDQAVDLLELAGVPEPHLRVRAKPHQLSSLDRQRAQLALALANKPRRLIARDAAAGLDATDAAAFTALLRHLQAQRGFELVERENQPPSSVSSSSSST